MGHVFSRRRAGPGVGAVGCAFCAPFEAVEVGSGAQDAHHALPEPLRTLTRKTQCADFLGEPRSASALQTSGALKIWDALSS